MAASLLSVLQKGSISAFQQAIMTNLASLEEKDSNGWAVLHHAANDGKHDAIALLTVRSLASIPICIIVRRIEMLMWMFKIMTVTPRCIWLVMETRLRQPGTLWNSLRSLLWLSAQNSTGRWGQHQHWEQTRPYGFALGGSYGKRGNTRVTSVLRYISFWLFFCSHAGLSLFNTGWYYFAQ